MEKLFGIPAVWCRVFGYLFTIVVHMATLGNSIRNLFDENIMKDPELRQLKPLHEYMTIFNFCLQIGYACLGLCCDIVTLKAKQVPKIICTIRDKIFSIVLFPSSMVVASVVWSLWVFDRNLIYPEYLDKAFSTTTNLIIHLLIVPVALWELMFRPRPRPESYRCDVILTIFAFQLVALRLLIGFLVNGSWPYPILDIAYSKSGLAGDVFLDFIAQLQFTAFYFLQWWLVDLFWKKDKKQPKENKLLNDNIV